ncbi:MAG: CT583 family protein, partial [Chlamydiota bacterium]
MYKLYLILFYTTLLLQLFIIETSECTSNEASSVFSNVFHVEDLSIQDKFSLERILKTYFDEPRQLTQDLEELCKITSEVKAINNQAVLLHGERIKKAQQILKHYKIGAFSSWLIAVYGNRSTPYNFLQYYEFYISLSKAIQ